MVKTRASGWSSGLWRSVARTDLHGVFDNLEWTRQYLNEPAGYYGLRAARGTSLLGIKDFKDRVV